MKKIEELIEDIVKLVERRCTEKNLDELGLIETELIKAKRKLIHPDNGAYFAVFFHLKDTNPVLYSEKHIFQTKAEAERDIENLNKAHALLAGTEVFFEIRRVVILETDITNWL